MAFFFVQLADPQFGMYAALSGLDEERLADYRRRGMKIEASPKITGLDRETELYEKAIAAVNRLSPDFVITCGDMVNDADQPAQYEELMRVTAGLDDGIPMHWVVGNHDMGNIFTTESLALYRERFGKDDYYFDHAGSRFVVLNTNIAVDPTQIPNEWNRQRAFAEYAIGEARAQSADHIIVFTHYPLFLRDAEEADGPIVVPRERRRVLLEILRRHRVTAVFSGHWHRNCYARDGDIEMVTSGSVGYPLGDDPSGLRVVKVFEDRVEHEYFALDAVPDRVVLP